MPNKFVTAEPFLPNKITIPALQKAAETCKGCHLYKFATQVVFGEGPANADIVIVGEIPGAKEDEAGHPFVGPAGTLLRTTLEDADINLKKVYLTNVVKHFKFLKSGNKRLHRSPDTAEVKACKPWLEAEIDVIRPQLILCLGATAAKAVIDKNFKIIADRGKWFTSFKDNKTLATYHPSAILRAPDRDARHQMLKLFARDIKFLGKAL